MRQKNDSTSCRFYCCEKIPIYNRLKHGIMNLTMYSVNIQSGDVAMNRKIQDQNVELLMQAIATLRDPSEAMDFFEDLCTINELKAMSQRLAVARMLREQKVYTEIVEKTGASTATISRVNRCLHYGADGYNEVLDRLDRGEGKV
jgi:TrpR-related protein YerC/YecD